MTTEPNRLSPADRYNRDPNFNRLVSVLELAIHQCEYTPTEIREAAMLAAIRYETVHCRPAVRIEDSGMTLFNSQLFRPGSKTWEIFHRAWTTAVGQPGYDGKVWAMMEKALHNAAQEVR